MVTLNRIYTRTGDGGSTGLATGERVAKTDRRVVAIGDVDETNACIGLARLHLAAAPALDALFGRVQNELFDLGADLASPERPERPLRFEPLRVTAAQAERLERDIDRLNGELPPLTSFVLPGGTPAGAALHLARTVCRRAERSAFALAQTDGEAVSGPVLAYLNRLSDLLFVAARYANGRGADEVLWRPGATRED